MNVKQEAYGSLPLGKEISQIILTNDNDITVKLISYGASISEVIVPDKDGNLDNVILSYENLEGFLNDQCFFGCAVGRFANRIANGKFNLDGKEYQLDCNEGGFGHLHGGKTGYYCLPWEAESYQDEEGVHAKFMYSSPDGEEGYPGNVEVSVVYTLNNDNELILDYAAVTDRATPINLTNHGYWNLKGAGNGSILDHDLQMMANHYLPINAQSVPLGEIAPVDGTAMDFVSKHAIGELLDGVKEGYDHCYVLNKETQEYALAAVVEDKTTGRKMEVFTDQFGLQLYIGNHLKDVAGIDGKTYQSREGFCLEAQNFPDAPNQADFPDCILRPGEIYTQRTTHKFGLI